MTELLPEVKQHGKFVPQDWQLQDLAHLAELDVSANWSEMGCFKTSTVLWLAEHKTASRPFPSIMIITTPSGKGTYYEAVPAILPEFTLIDVTTQGAFLVNSKGERVKIDDVLPPVIEVPHVILTHYHVFTKLNKGEPERHPESKLPLKNPVTGSIIMKPWTQADYLLERKWHIIALDEAHRIKNRETKWTGNIKKLDCDFRHVMTGTGFINRPDEIWSLLNFLDSYTYSSYWKFRDTYCEVETFSGYQQVTGIKPEKREEFRKLVRTIGVRRTLDEVMPHIRQPIYVRRDVELNKIQRTMFDQIKRELKLLDKKGEPIHSPNVISALQRMRQICVATPELIKDYYDEKLERRVQEVRLVEPSSKLDDLMELLSELQWDDEDKQQVVVFSCFKDPLELLQARLEKAQIPFIWMKQSDNEKVRYEKWFEQWPKKQHQVFMSTLQLGSESINLSSARHVVFLDRSWSPKDNSQGIGRIRRPGQEGQPVVINIEAENTTDQKLERTNIKKHGWFMEIFGEEDDD
jgi:SNF2 family DNA or RNA helicase